MNTIEESVKSCPNLESLTVDLEEEALLQGKLGVTKLLPIGAGVIEDIPVDALPELCEKGALASFNGLADFHEQAFAGAEVVDEHAMAGARGLCDRSQALVGDARCEGNLDHRLQQTFLGS